MKKNSRYSEETMTIFLGIDDTDTPESRGTGRLARSIARELAEVIRFPAWHATSSSSTIPSHTHNSAAVIHIDTTVNGCREDILATCREMMAADFIEGSDPGICTASRDHVSPGILAFGRMAKETVLTQGAGRRVAATNAVHLEGLGGTNNGIIGALAGVGLAATGNDGRFILRGRSRELTGLQDVQALLRGGIDEVRCGDGILVTKGSVAIRKFPRPALKEGKAVLFVEGDDGQYRDCVVG